MQTNNVVVLACWLGGLEGLFTGGFRGVRLRSLCVLIAQNPEETRGRWFE